MEYFLDDRIDCDHENDLHEYMLINTNSIIGLAQSFVEYQVEIGKMAPVECLFDPLYDNVFDLIERLDIKEAVINTMRFMMEEERAVQLPE